MSHCTFLFGGKDMKGNNTAKFFMVSKEIMKVLQDNPTIDMVSLSLDMNGYSAIARIRYIDKTDVRDCVIEVK